MPFISKSLYDKFERIVNIINDSVDDVSKLKAAALKRRVEFLISELEIIKNQEQSIQSELSELQLHLEELKEE